MLIKDLRFPSGYHRIQNGAFARLLITIPMTPQKAGQAAPSIAGPVAPKG